MLAVRGPLFVSCMPCFAHDPIKLPSHSGELITNKRTTTCVLVQCLGGEYAWVRCAASSRDRFFSTSYRRAGRGASWRRRKYRQRRTGRHHLGRHARRKPNRTSTAQIETRRE